MLHSVALLALANSAALAALSVGARGAQVCGGAPQDLLPFKLEDYRQGVEAGTARRLLQLENDTSRHQGVETDSGHLSWEDGDFWGSGNDTDPWGEWESSETRPRGRALLRMPYQMKRVGCGRRRRARVYFENADSDPTVRKEIRTGEEGLVKCLESIGKCDVHAYKSASLLKVAKSKIMSLFKPGSLAERQYNTCAIVGNAGHMIKKKYGKYIDNHDLVMRFNTQQVGRFKDKVGSKVTMRILNNFHTTQACCNGKLPEGRRNKIDMVLWFPAARVEMRRVCKKKYKNHKLHFLSRRFIGKEVMVMRELRKEMKRLGFGPFGGWKQLTSGAHGLLMLLTMCNQVSVYGMTTYVQSSIDQYGGRQRKTKNGNSWHDWKGESHVWRLLHAMKEVAICSM